MFSKTSNSVQFWGSHSALFFHSITHSACLESMLLIQSISISLASGLMAALLLLSCAVLVLWPVAYGVRHTGRHDAPSIRFEPVDDLALRLVASLDVETLRGSSCTCTAHNLCQHVTFKHDKEFFGFIYPASQNFRHYNWTRLTSVAWLEDPELVCTAHQHGVRVIKNAGDVSRLLHNATSRVEWVRTVAEHVLMHSLDGVNFDYEGPQSPGSNEAAAYTELVQLTSVVLHTVCPECQVSVDFPWSPYDVDGRNYDWQGLAGAADLVFIMAYDMQSQVWGRCVASANCPVSQMMRGLHQWFNLGVPRDKMILGLPWYGYDYPCAPDIQGVPAASDVDVCTMLVVPFTGAACSDAAGMQVPYLQIMAMIWHGLNTTAIRWDDVQQAPTFNYLDDQNVVHQVWFDNPQSLLLRYKQAAALGLRGVGCWNLEWLYVSARDNPRAAEDAQAMWQAVDVGFFST